MKIKLLKPKECLLQSRNFGDVIEVYWDEPNECWKECYKEDPAGFLEDWWEKGFFEFIEERPTTKQASENPFKVGDRVKVVVSEGELIDNGCDESVQSGVVYTVQEVEEENLRLGPEDTCSWVAYYDVDIEPAKGQASTIDHINSFTKHHKDIEISFENGKMGVRDWRGKGDPVEYKCDTFEQLEELMGAWEIICKFKTGEC